MRNVLILAVAVATAACATPGERAFITPSMVAAGDVDDRAPRYQSYEGTLPPIREAVALDVKLSADLADRATNLGDRSGRVGLRNGFATDGYLGEPGLVRLREDAIAELSKRLAREGVTVDANAATVLRVRLVDARPNRPTFEQLSEQPSLDFNSVGLGGASFEGELVRAGGEAIGEFRYGFYSNLIDNAAFGTTWTDADRAVERMARRVARELSRG